MTLPICRHCGSHEWIQDRHGMRCARCDGYDQSQFPIVTAERTAFTAPIVETVIHHYDPKLCEPTAESSPVQWQGLTYRDAPTERPIAVRKYRADAAERVAVAVAWGLGMALCFILLCVLVARVR